MSTVSEIRARFYAALEQGAGQSMAVAIANGTEAPKLDLTREGIAEMDKAEVIELLEAHGADPDKRTGVEKLREQLIALVFVD